MSVCKDCGPRALLLAGTAILFVSAEPVAAQTASQVTPPTFQPPRMKPGRGIVIPEDTGPAAPAGAEDLEVQIADVSIEGGLPALAEDSARVRGELTGRTVSAAELFAAARRLEQAYATRGYGLVRVVLPAQNLVDGATVRIVVIDGFFERIDTSSLPVKIRARVATLLAPLVGRRGITTAAIERKLLLAGDLPGTVLRSTLSQGDEPGGSLLTVEARYTPVTGSLTVDNRLSEPLGRYKTGIDVSLNSVFGLGELVYLHASGAPRFGADDGFFADAPRHRVLAGGVSLPLGHDGLMLNLEATVPRTAPEVDTGSYAFLSDFTRYAARLDYPLIRSRDLTLNVSGAFEALEEDLSLIDLGGAAVSRDRLRVVRTGAYLTWHGTGSSLLTAGLSGSFGINGLGARSAADADASNTPLSRQGADADFQKVELSLGYRTTVGERLAVDLRAQAQTSFGRPLLNAEQTGLASATGLSTFGSGLLQGDDGFVVRAEAQLPYRTAVSLPFAARQGAAQKSQPVATGVVLASPYLFGAYGGVRLHRPSVLETAWTEGAAYGVGVRLAAAEPASGKTLSLNLEYGRADRFGDGPDDNRFTITAALQF